MTKDSLKRLSILPAVVFVLAASSCKKEEITALPPAEETKAPSLIFIRAVEKNGSITNSEQIPLR